jgi:hypothetical protein
MGMRDKIFCCYLFNEERHSHVGKNLRPIQPWIINLISTVTQSGKVCVKCRITFYKMRKTCDLYDNPGADANELQNVEQEEHIHPIKQKMLVLQMLLLK